MGPCPILSSRIFEIRFYVTRVVRICRIFRRRRGSLVEVFRLFFHDRGCTAFSTMAPLFSCVPGLPSGRSSSLYFLLRSGLTSFTNPTFVSGISVQSPVYDSRQPGWRECRTFCAMWEFCFAGKNEATVYAPQSIKQLSLNSNHTDNWVHGAQILLLLGTCKTWQTTRLSHPKRLETAP